MPQTTQDIIRIIDSDNELAVSAMLWDLLNTHKRKQGDAERAAYKRYKQDREGVPIFSKDFADWEKVSEMIPNDFFGDIVDLKTGYMGNEVIIQIDKRKVTDEAEREKDDMFLQTFSQAESLLDENSELVKTAAISGVAYRLLFVDRDGAARLMNSDPWETALFMDPSLQIPTFGMRYFKMEEIQFSAGDNKINKEEKFRIEWYDEAEITFYRENDSGIFVIDTTRPATGPNARKGRQPHLYNGVPIIDFPNNKEELGEVSKVLELIDAYDDIISDATSEIQQLRMAYMWARGAGMVLDAEFQEKLRQTGLWPLPEDGEIGFASKDLGGAGTFVETVLGEIRRNIYSFSKSIDLSQDRGGNLRVIGWQIALLRLEMSASVTERKFKKGYLRQYTLLTDLWRSTGRADIDPLALRYIFTRKFPKDVDQEIDTLVKGMEVLPLDTIYGLMSFIDNPIELAEKFREERPEMQSVLQGLDDAAESEVG